jgi:hypothetical protein
MSHCLYQPDELMLVRGQLEVACCEQSTEECERSRALMKDRVEPHARGITVNHEGLVEVWHLEDRSRRQGTFECLECCLNLVVLSKRVLPQETRKRGYDDTKVAAELPVVPREVQESKEALGRPRRRVKRRLPRPYRRPWRHRLPR